MKYLRKINEEYHKQKPIKIKVDEKIQPLIQFIYNKLPGIIPTASCIGGNKSTNGTNDSSIDTYILLIAENYNHLNHLMELCSITYCQYIKPDPETGNVPTYRVTIPDLDSVLKKLKLIENGYIFY